MSQFSKALKTISYLLDFTSSLTRPRFRTCCLKQKSLFVSLDSNTSGCLNVVFVDIRFLLLSESLKSVCPAAARCFHVFWGAVLESAGRVFPCWELFCSVVIRDENINVHSVVFVCALGCKILPLINTAIVLEEEPEFLQQSPTDGRQIINASDSLRL